MWELREAELMECIIDTSGVYTIINRAPDGRVRVDLMYETTEPIISFIGSAENVRKRLMEYIEIRRFEVSLQHAAYMGYELHRAEADRFYVQD